MVESHFQIVSCFCLQHLGCFNSSLFCLSLLCFVIVYFIRQAKVKNSKFQKEWVDHIALPTHIYSIVRSIALAGNETHQELVDCIALPTDTVVRSMTPGSTFQCQSKLGLRCHQVDFTWSKKCFGAFLYSAIQMLFCLFLASIQELIG